MLSVFNLVYRLLICLTIRAACLHKSWNQKHISENFLNVQRRFLLSTYLSLVPHTLPLFVDQWSTFQSHLPTSRSWFSLRKDKSQYLWYLWKWGRVAELTTEVLPRTFPPLSKSGYLGLNQRALELLNQRSYQQNFDRALQAWWTTYIKKWNQSRLFYLDSVHKYLKTK